jgi:hypothetical protein
LAAIASLMGLQKGIKNPKKAELKSTSSKLELKGPKFLTLSVFKGGKGNCDNHFLDREADILPCLTTDAYSEHGKAYFDYQQQNSTNTSNRWITNSLVDISWS